MKQEDNDHLAGPYHGVGGPLKVSHLGQHCRTSRASCRPCRRGGLPTTRTSTVTGRPAPVSCSTPSTRPPADGAALSMRSCGRCSPILRLTVETGTTAMRIRIEHGQAVGVDFTSPGGAGTAYADTEVILAAGTYASPTILMLSGLGPAQELARLGVRVEADLPGVGRNLQDHHEVPVVAGTTGAFGYFGQDRGLAMLAHGLQYVMFRSGAVTTTAWRPARSSIPTAARGRRSSSIAFRPSISTGTSRASPTHGVTPNPCLLRPKARGSVRPASADPLAPPQVDAQFFGHPDDLRLTIAGLRYAREVLATSPLKDLVDRELFPGADTVSDEDLAAHCRRTVKTNYHPVGTCRMGRDGDPDAVATADLKVRGVEGLRVIDASIMPTIPSGNTNAPVLAIADKAVEIIARREGPRRSGACRLSGRNGPVAPVSASCGKSGTGLPIERCAASGAPSRSPRPRYAAVAIHWQSVDKPRCHPHTCK